MNLLLFFSYEVHTATHIVLHSAIVLLLKHLQKKKKISLLLKHTKLNYGNT